MTYLDVFVGELADGDDPLDWGGSWKGSNTPTKSGPFFPPDRHGKAFWQVQEAVEQKRLPGKQVDWGAWAAIASKEYILEFIENLYRGDPWYEDPSEMPHLYAQLQEVLDYVRSLPDGRDYALVACEL